MKYKKAARCCELVIRLRVRATTRPPDHPVTVDPPMREAGLVPGVNVERPAGRTTLTPGARSARLARVDGDGMIRLPSIPEPERPRRRRPGLADTRDRRWVMSRTTSVLGVSPVSVRPC
jgi:hypothetical protein